MTYNLRPLHNLYQTISPAALLEGEAPLVAVSQLERKAGTPRGEIEWVIGVGAKGDDQDQLWWSTRLNPAGFEELLNQLEGKAIVKDTIVEMIRTRWKEGRLNVRGFEESQTTSKRRPIDLVVYFPEDIPLSIPLPPCETAPLSLLSIMAHIIPPYVASSKSQAALRTLEPRLASAQQERDKLASDNYLLREEVKELKKRMRGEKSSLIESGKRTREGSEGTSQLQVEGSQSRREFSASASPQKKGRPGIDFKAVMRPGTKGYAGSSNRVGRNLDDEWEEPDSDSD